MRARYHETNDGSYVCAQCGGTFDFVPGANDHALAEARRDYDGVAMSDMAIV